MRRLAPAILVLLAIVLAAAGCGGGGSSSGSTAAARPNPTPAARPDQGGLHQGSGRSLRRRRKTELTEEVKKFANEHSIPISGEKPTEAQQTELFQQVILPNIAKQEHRNSLR